MTAQAARWTELGWLDGLVRSGGLAPALPAVLYLLVALVAPLVVLLSFGFITIERGVVVPGAWSLEHYQAALADPSIWRLTGRSAWLAAATVGLTLLFGYPLAYAYTWMGRLGRTLVLLIVVAPLLTSVLVRIFAWYVILGGRRGILNAVLLGSGLIDTPLRILNTETAVLIGMTQIHLPFMILPLIAVLAGRDRAIEEASVNLGASRVQTFLRVTLPVSLPGIVAGSALVLALSYTTFVIPQLLGGGNYATLPVKVYEQTVIVLDWTRGAVLAGIMLVTCFAFVLALTWLGGRATRWQ